MKPLRFTVKKLRNIPNDTRIIEMRKVGSDGDDYQITWEDLGEAVWELKVLAYQLTPCGCYIENQKRCTDKLVLSCIEEPSMLVWQTDRTFNFKICGFKTTMPFLIPAEHYEQFKQAVHEYNLKYADVPDMKVLDGLEKWMWLKGRSQDEAYRVINGYKATLCNKDKWFEMEGE